ncbi:MAG TPA: hypothetical protein VJ397_01115 [Thermoplasmata archaeon]|nr:hypothetical protein [Thermoplasmata archaeon]
MGLSDLLAAALGGLGPAGLALALYLIFVVDAAVFPALPEIWIAIFFPSVPAGWSVPAWAAFLLAMAVLGEATGNSLMYWVARGFHRRGKWPRFLEKAMRKWTQFLFVRDERIILVNRVAPVVPFVGAFIAVLKWDYGKSLDYIVVGATAKYTFLLALIGMFLVAYDREMAQWLTLLLIAVVIAVSAVSSYVYRRRLTAAPAVKSQDGEPR